MADVPAHRAFRVSVVRLVRLSPSFLRITLGGLDLEHFGAPGPDHRIKVMLPLPGIGFTPLPQVANWYQEWRQLPAAVQNPIRTYTVRSVRPETRELDVDFVLHGATGPASAWAENCAPGDEVILIGPNAAFDGPCGGYDFHPPVGTEQYLIAGDETATPAILNIIKSLPPQASGLVVLETPLTQDSTDICAPEGVRVVWLPRDQPTAERGSALIPLVCDNAAAMIRHRQPTEELEDLDIDGELLWDSPAEVAIKSDGFYAWFAGEAGMVKTLRRHLVSELGVDRSAVAFLGYWRQGRPENN